MTAAARVTPRSPVSELETLILARLHPLDRPPTTGGRSDFDLNPQARRRAEAVSDAAVLAPIVDRPEGLTVLLTRRSDALTRHSGQIAFPGGRADPGETAVETALREAEEEIGLERRFVRPVGFGDLYETVTGFRITPVVAFVSPGFRLVPSEAEVAEVFEAPFAWLMDPANHELHARPDPASGLERRFYVMPWEGRSIWGATAGMLRGLYERLFDEV